MTHTSKNLTPKQRLEGLRALVRHKANYGKVLTGRVSERKSDFENKLKAEVPKTHAECEARLKDLQAQWTKIEEAKEERGAFKAKQKEAEYQLLFAEVVEGDAQLTLEATDPVITRESMTHLKTAITTVQTEEDKRGEDDVEIEYPRPDAAELESLEATLDDWLAETGLDKTELASEAKAQHPDEIRKPPKRNRGKNKPKAETKPEAEAETNTGMPEDDEDVDTDIPAANVNPSLHALN
jgi:hypothetical protein